MLHCVPPGSSAGWSTVPTHQGCGFGPCSGHIRDTTNECISDWNNESMFLSLSLLSLSKKTKRNYIPYLKVVKKINFKVLITRRKIFCNYIQQWLLTRLTVVIVSQIWNHYVTPELRLYGHYTSIFKLHSVLDV